MAAVGAARITAATVADPAYLAQLTVSGRGTVVREGSWKGYGSQSAVTVVMEGIR